MPFLPNLTGYDAAKGAAGDVQVRTLLIIGQLEHAALVSAILGTAFFCL